MLQNNPDDNLLRLQYARLLTTTDMPAAREQFEILSEQHPDDGDLLFSLALINHEIADPEAAQAYLLQTSRWASASMKPIIIWVVWPRKTTTLREALARYMQIGFGPEYLAANNRIGQILIEGDQLERYHAGSLSSDKSILPCEMNSTA